MGGSVAAVVSDPAFDFLAAHESYRERKRIEYGFGTNFPQYVFFRPVALGGIAFVGKPYRDF